jgi:pyrroline-5-carboxylate reductase
MTHMKIAFLGAGNMASCLIESILQQGYPANCLAASNRNAKKLTALSKLGIQTTTDNLNLAKYDLIVLAVKPQHMQGLIEQLTSHLNAKALISIAAGITIPQIQAWLGHAQIPIYRAMPNTPSRYGLGITALFAATASRAGIKQEIESLFNAVGDTVWVDQEDQMNIVTALSGSGPAYFFYLLEALIQGATQLGLSETVATQLALKTAYGASVMALTAPEKLETLRQQVTSKGGTTESGLAALQQGDLFGLIAKTLQAATERGKTLSALYSDSSK